MKKNIQHTLLLQQALALGLLLLSACQVEEPMAAYGSEGAYTINSISLPGARVSDTRAGAGLTPRTLLRHIGCSGRLREREQEDGEREYI